MIIAPKYSFVQFNDNLNDCCCNIPLEVAESSDISFYISSDATIKLYLCNISGDIITEIENTVSWWINPTIDLSEYLACKDCFRFLIIENNISYYSNIFIYDIDTKHTLVNYNSTNISFFPFSEGSFNSLRLPIELLNRNPKTETEEYIDANGWIHNPFKLRRDVYDLNVNYSPVDFHKKIQVMLMHDVIIDDTPVNETGDYQIDYDESIFDNGTYLYRASTEVSEQDILLMRNY